MYELIFSTLPIFLAHAVPGDAGAIEGFLHPLLGFEHLLAMIAVGLLSAQMGGRAIWTVPVTFVAVMAVGGIVGFYGVSTPIVAYGIAASVILLGIALLIQRRIHEALALFVVGLFGIFHGYAHGEAVPAEQNFVFLVAFVVGFVMSTAGLHIIGALLGYIAMRGERGPLILRVTGSIITVIGVFFLLNVGAN